MARRLHTKETAFFLFFIFSLILSIFYFLFSNTALAQVSPTLSVSPAKYDMAVIPGSVEQKIIKITNQSDVAVPMTMKVLDFAPRDKDGGISFDQSIPGHSAVSWFTVKKPELLLGPHETREVDVSLAPPENVAPGSYFAVVMFESGLPEHYFDPAAQTRIVPWIGVLFLLKNGDPPQISNAELSIKNLTIPRLTFKRTIPVTVELQNTSAFHLAPETQLELKNLRGQTVAVLTPQNTTILPGSSRVFRGELTTARLAAANSVLSVGVNIKLGSFEHSVTSKPLFMLTSIFIILVVTLGIIGFFIYHRERVRRAWHILIHGRF